MEGRGHFNRLSLAGMLATANDGFFALNGISLPRHGTEALTVVPGTPAAKPTWTGTTRLHRS